MPGQVVVRWVGLECRQRQETTDEIYGTVSLLPGTGSHTYLPFPADGTWRLGATEPESGSSTSSCTAVRWCRS